VGGVLRAGEVYQCLQMRNPCHQQVDWGLEVVGTLFGWEEWWEKPERQDRRKERLM
jgi:hypothetical protein